MYLQCRYDTIRNDLRPLVCASILVSIANVLQVLASPKSRDMTTHEYGHEYKDYYTSSVSFVLQDLGVSYVQILTGIDTNCCNGDPQCPPKSPRD
jgi:hypothetical protein